MTLLATAICYSLSTSCVAASTGGYLEQQKRACTVSNANTALVCISNRQPNGERNVDQPAGVKIESRSVRLVNALAVVATCSENDPLRGVLRLLKGDKRPNTIPCDQRAGHEGCRKRHRRDLLRTEAAVRDWHRDFPDENYGIVQGDGHVTFDPDTYKENFGAAAWSKAEALLPVGPVVITAHGGQHLTFRKPINVRISNTKSRFGKSVDIKTGNGYVVGPGSVVDGVMYALVNDRPAPMLTAEVLAGLMAVVVDSAAAPSVLAAPVASVASHDASIIDYSALRCCYVAAHFSNADASIAAACRATGLDWSSLRERRLDDDELSADIERIRAKYMGLYTPQANCDADTADGSAAPASAPPRATIRRRTMARLLRGSKVERHVDLAALTNTDRATLALMVGNSATTWDSIPMAASWIADKAKISRHAAAQRLQRLVAKKVLAVVRRGTHDGVGLDRASRYAISLTAPPVDDVPSTAAATTSDKNEHGLLNYIDDLGTHLVGGALVDAEHAEGVTTMQRRANQHEPDEDKYSSMALQSSADDQHGSLMPTYQPDGAADLCRRDRECGRNGSWFGDDTRRTFCDNCSRLFTLMELDDTCRAQWTTLQEALDSEAAIIGGAEYVEGDDGSLHVVARSAADADADDAASADARAAAMEHAANLTKLDELFDVQISRDVPERDRRCLSVVDVFRRAIHVAHAARATTPSQAAAA